MWVVAEGHLPDEEDDIKKPKAGPKPRRVPRRRPPLTPELVSWREAVRQSGLPLYWLPEFALGLATLGRRCRRLVRITLRVDAEAQRVFFEAPRAAEVDSMAGALAALCGRKAAGSG